MSNDIPLSLRVRPQVACRRVQAGGTVPYDFELFQSDALIPFVGREIRVVLNDGGRYLCCSDDENKKICYAKCVGTAINSLRRAS